MEGLLHPELFNSPTPKFKKSPIFNPFPNFESGSSFTNCDLSRLKSPSSKSLNFLNKRSATMKFKILSPKNSNRSLFLPE